LFQWINRLRGEWRLEGWDTFAGHSYPLNGHYRSRAAAIAAARLELKRIERLQPTSSSGGQDGIQDRVYIIAPDGTSERILPLY
jgi:hypothetical protein